METIEEIIGKIKPYDHTFDSNAHNRDVTPDDHYDTLLRKSYPLRCVTFLRRDTLRGPALEKARELWRDYITHEDAIIVLCGKPGTGKTMMATLWALHRLKKGLSCGFYRKTVDLLRELTDTFDTQTKEIAVLEKYQRTSYLVLDEYMTAQNHWKNETLTNLLDHRYDNMLTTVIITNTPRDKFISEINPSWFDRIMHCGTILECNWDSYRL